MAVTIKQTEAIPASYPDVPSGLSTAAAALDSDMIWQRIERYIAHRWTSRAVTWVVEGEGEWTPPLTPATISATDVWESNAWTSVTLDDAPLGGYEIEDCIYRFTATVGSGTVPAAVNEAFSRLAEYMAETEDRHGTSRLELDVGGFREAYDRAPTWLARAMQNSGAADLLRPYRRA